MFNKYKDILI